jgi:hypothetical protein
MTHVVARLSYAFGHRVRVIVEAGDSREGTASSHFLSALDPPSNLARLFRERHRDPRVDELVVEWKIIRGLGKRHSAKTADLEFIVYQFEVVARELGASLSISGAPSDRSGGASRAQYDAEAGGSDNG